MTASRANRWVAIGVVGLVVAVVVWLASDGTDSRRANVAGGEPSARARDRAVVESVASSPVGDEQGATDPRSADSTVAAPALDLVTIHGRVVHADGSPAGDAIVRLRTGIPDLDYAELVERRAGPPKLDRSARTRRIAAYAQARGGWERAFATRSRIDGTFRLEVPRELAVFTLVARRGDESFDCGEPFDLSPSRVAEGFLLPLESAGTIAGTILGADGKPVADARVEATDCSMINGAEFMFARGYVERSDGEGRFAFRALPRGDWSVEASAPGCQEAKAEVTLARGATARVDLRLGHGEVIEGRVIDGSGAPVAGALVFGSITDAEGRFRVDNVAPGRHRLTIFHDDGWEALVDGAYPKVEIPRPAGAPPIVLVLERGRRMSGRVVDGAGRGLAHVIVNVSPSGWGFEVWSPKPGKHSTIRVVETDSDGRFHAGGLADGPFRVVATLENVASIEKTVASADPAFVELVMPATTGISGRVVDAVDRSPIEGFRVYAYPSEQGLGVYLDQRESRTFSAPDGRFDLLGLSPGVYSVRAITDGRPEASSAEVVVES
ncbi:MAG TPA: carboxypeptidase-like regulatory domain-containing protein, partial [Planctomycetota bacterium]|nr:carboxypeptidase-like regulatory domain-containing protein [Planctomycetota bacterium]